MVLSDISQKDKAIIDEGRKRFIESFDTPEEKAIARWQMYPEYFIDEVLGINEENGLYLTNQQKELFSCVGRLSFCKRVRADAEKEGTLNYLPRAIRNYANKSGVSIRAGRGVGKSFSASLLIYWLLLLFDNSKIPVIAPSERTLRQVMWSELSIWYNKKNEKGEYIFQEPFRSKINMMGKSVRYEDRQHHFAEMKVAPNVADKGMASAVVSGLHGYTFVPIIDEMNGVRDEIFSAILDSMTDPNNFFIGMYNPTRTSGYAYDTHFNPSISEFTINLHWNAEDSDRISKEYLKNLQNRYGGRDSNEYRVSVLGEPPDAEDNALIPYRYVNEALSRQPSPKNDYPYCFGIDVARSGGDKSCVCIRKGFDIIDFKYINGVDVFVFSEDVYRLAEEYKPEQIIVDSSGLGVGYYDAVRKLYPQQTVGIGFGDGARQKDKYRYMRDEMWHRMRGLFMKEPITIPNNERLRVALSTTRFKDDGGKIKLEPKDLVRKRISFSPDEADALCLSFAGNDLQRHNSYAKEDFEDGYDRAYAELKSRSGSWMST